MAVQSLAKVMTDIASPPQARVSAAVALLRFGREGVELDDLAARVELIEQQLGREQARTSHRPRSLAYPGPPATVNGDRWTLQ